MPKDYASDKIPIFALDFEGAIACGIVEFGIAEIRNWEIVSLKTSLCAPRQKVAPKTMDMCGFSPSELKRAPKFESFADDFIQMRKAGLFAAHNKGAESSMLNSYFPNPSAFTDFTNNTPTFSWSPFIDTLVLVKKIFPMLKSAALSDVIVRLGLLDRLNENAQRFCPKTRQKWHCAPYDALACAEIIIALSKLEGFENLTVKWLAQNSANNNQLSLF